MTNQKAYSYLRFSTPDQMKGDSFRRQTMLADEYTERHGLELDRELTFRDLGVSAFRGKNAETGRLGDFLQAVDDGLVRPGSYLLVESLDRISRQAARKALRVLEDIADRGVTVVTLNDGRAYDADSLNNDPMALLLALLTFIRANEESATKARRLRAVWQSKRQKAASGMGMTARCPAWLRLDIRSRLYEVIPERAAVVRAIFSMADQGIGLHGIASALNRQAVPTFGNGGRRAEFWERSYVSKIIGSPAVVGTFIPHTIEYANGQKSRMPEEPITGYFPAVVEAEVHARVTSARLSGRAPATRIEKVDTLSLLAGLASCPWCGSTMTRVSKGKKGGQPRLTCVRARKGVCAASSVPQPEVENVLVYMADTLSCVPEGDYAWHEKRIELVQQIGGWQRQIEAATDELLEVPSMAVRARLRVLEAEKDSAERKLREVAARAVAAGPGLQRAALELRAALKSTQLNRPAVNNLLRQMFDHVVVDGDDRILRFAWKHGVEQICSLDVPSSPHTRGGVPKVSAAHH